jgi:hypothetical protein
MPRPRNVLALAYISLSFLSLTLLFPRVELRTVNKHVAPVAKAERKVLMS